MKASSLDFSNRDSGVVVRLMKIHGALIEGVFENRLNRFTAMASVNGLNILCFVPNPGRMEELLTPGTRIILREVKGRSRKTSYDLMAVYSVDCLVSIDSRIPNRLLLEAFQRRCLEEFSQYSLIKMEYVYGRSRFDFLLYSEEGRCLIEAKSCTLVKDHVAFFPDAPTSRGRRHLSDLAKARREGYRACIVFVVQRMDANVFSPNYATDPEFGVALHRACTEGVEVYAYSSELRGDEVFLREKMSIRF